MTDQAKLISCYLKEPVHRWLITNLHIEQIGPLPVRAELADSQLHNLN